MSPSRCVAVVVDYHAEEALGACVDSLRANGVGEVVVVENGEAGSSPSALEGRGVILVEPGLNLGYGRGVNRVVAAAPPSTYLVVSNPDVIAHDGAVSALTAFLDEHEGVAVAGPSIVRPDGTVYPSQRVFPNVWLAGAHALLAPLWPSNPATAAYRSARADGTVDWVSGAFFVIRRDAFEAVGGFDERYFMFAEDMALCWQLREHGYAVAGVPAAVVTHVEGLSRQRASRAMILAHHRSALRFEWQTARGMRRLLAPLATVVLGIRLAVVLVARPRGGPGA
ncbi:MAG: glycosyltransferase family 2 protein [Acidobacteriota bacterium]|nr:glycosyltransferase family 2 protein [Acidobacteriota bacterium]